MNETKNNGSLTNDLAIKSLNIHSTYQAAIITGLIRLLYTKKLASKEELREMIDSQKEITLKVFSEVKTQSNYSPEYIAEADKFERDVIEMFDTTRAGLDNLED